MPWKRPGFQSDVNLAFIEALRKVLGLPPLHEPKVGEHPEEHDLGRVGWGCLGNGGYLRSKPGVQS